MKILDHFISGMVQKYNTKLLNIYSTYNGKDSSNDKDKKN